MRNSGLRAAPLETDVFIVGGGPAGLAAAIAARQKGFRVAIADSATQPVDKACGEGLMPDGIAALRELGITIPAAQRFPFRGIRFVEGNLAAQSDFSNERGSGIRRTTLHTALAERAAALGVEMHWGNRVVGLNGNNSETRNSTEAFPWKDAPYALDGSSALMDKTHAFASGRNLLLRARRVFATASAVTFK